MIKFYRNYGFDGENVWNLKTNKKLKWLNGPDMRSGPGYVFLYDGHGNRFKVRLHDIFKRIESIMGEYSNECQN